MKEKPFPSLCPFCDGETVIRYGSDNAPNRAETRCVVCGRRTSFLDFNILIPIVKKQWTYDDAADFHIDCAKRAREWAEKRR
jgi:transcription elongation factor Elf1